MKAITNVTDKAVPTYTEDDIKAAADAITAALSLEPTLLFKAMTHLIPVNGDIMVNESLPENERILGALRYEIANSVSDALVHTELVVPDHSDLTFLVDFAMKRLTKKMGIKS